MAREVVVVSGVRTAIGTYGGSLKDIPPTAQVVRESLARANVAGADVGHVVFGHVVNTEPKDMYLSRVAAINGGCAESTPAFNVNRLCGSGLQAIVSAIHGGELCVVNGPRSASIGRFEPGRLQSLMPHDVTEIPPIDYRDPSCFEPC